MPPSTIFAMLLWMWISVTEVVGTSLLKTITTEDTYRSLLGMLITEEAERFYEPFGFRKDSICFMTRKGIPEVATNE